MMATADRCPGIPACPLCEECEHPACERADARLHSDDGWQCEGYIKRVIVDREGGEQLEIF